MPTRIYEVTSSTRRKFDITEQLNVPISFAYYFIWVEVSLSNTDILLYVSKLFYIKIYFFFCKYEHLVLSKFNITMVWFSKLYIFQWGH